jgi:hypothetical protein
MIHFKHQLPDTEAVNSLKQYCLTQGNTPYNPSSLSDQVGDSSLLPEKLNTRIALKSDILK